MTNAPVQPRSDATALGATSPDAAQPADAAAVAAIVADTAELARRRDRDDLARRLDQVAERVARTDTVVCVVGEFKKGKSALINALIEYQPPAIRPHVRTMVIGGASDAVFSVSEQVALAAQFRASRLRLFDDVGHAVHWERPEAFVRELTSFVK